jgi:hypothetical protein
LTAESTDLSASKRRARKGRPTKIWREAPSEPTIQTSLAADASSSSAALTTEAADIFAFQCEEPKISLVAVPKVKKLSEPKLKVGKVKACDLSDDLSETEEQVPLKITFKRPSAKEFGTKRGKAIKLRVKTQTTKDNGFKIQINQPKTKNPLKFKLKTSSKLFKKSSKHSKGKLKDKQKERQDAQESGSGCSVTLVVPGNGNVLLLPPEVSTCLNIFKNVQWCIVRYRYRYIVQCNFVKLAYFFK